MMSRLGLILTVVALVVTGPVAMAQGGGDSKATPTATKTIGTSKQGFGLQTILDPKGYRDQCERPECLCSRGGCSLSCCSGKN